MGARAFQSIRRAHKQNFDTAQQKLLSIKRSLSMLKKRPNIETTDDINIHYSKFSQSNINNNSVNFSTLNNNVGGKFASSNANFINNNIAAMSAAERRNSNISSSSGSTQYQSKPRSRCDSYGGQSSVSRISPTPSAASGYYQHHLHYSNHNHLADRIAFVTNAVAAAAAEAKSHAIHVSPKHGRFRKPLTVDTTDQVYYPMSAGSAGTNLYPAQQHRHSQLPPPPPPPPHSYHSQTLHAHSPYLPPKTFHMHVAPSTSDGKPNRDEDDDDDIAGQYATLLTLQPSGNDAKYQPQKPYACSEIDDADDLDDEMEGDTHYSVIESRKPKPANAGDAGTSHERHYQKNQIAGQWIVQESSDPAGYTLDNR